MRWRHGVDIIERFHRRSFDPLKCFPLKSQLLWSCQNADGILPCHNSGLFHTRHFDISKLRSFTQCFLHHLEIAVRFHPSNQPFSHRITDHCACKLCSKLVFIMNLFFMVSLSFHAIQADIRIGEFLQVGPTDTPLKQTKTSASLSARSQLECAVKCFLDGSCETIGYDEETKQCLLNKPAANGIELVYYRRVNTVKLTHNSNTYNSNYRITRTTLPDFPFVSPFK